MEIVAALALRHGWTRTRRGKIVWADIPHGQPPTYASWANPIQAQFGPLRTFTTAG